MKFIILFFLLISNSYAKTIVVSDLDETLRISQTHNYIVSLGEIIRGVRPFVAMQSLFNDFKQLEDVEFYYISASYYRFYNGKKWILRHHFPNGEVYQKPKLNIPNGDFKINTLNKLWNQGKFSQHDQFIFLGDNSSHDEDTYLNFRKQHALDGEIYIRDIKSKATPLGPLISVDQKIGINYFFTEWQLLESPLANLFSRTTQDLIEQQFRIKKGVVKTQLIYLKRQLKAKYCKSGLYFINIPCQIAVKRDIEIAISNYFKQ